MSLDPVPDTGTDHRHKWLHREPEMGLVLRFVPLARQAAFLRWGILLCELREAAFELSDARVIAAKTAWWAEELVRIAQGSARHPLSAGLDPGWSWLPVARALVDRQALDGPASTPEQAWAGVEPLARALSRLEADWFSAPAEPEDSTRALAAHLLGQRLVVGRGADDGARVPMSLLARHGLVPADLGGTGGGLAVADWAGSLLERLPDALPDANLFRQLRRNLDQEQLHHLRLTPELPWKPGPGSVLRAWRTARRARSGE